MPRFALATLNHSPLYGCPVQWQVHLDAAAEAGFDGLAPDVFWLRALLAEGVALERLARELAARSLACVELAGIAIGPDPAEADRELTEMLVFAEALGAEWVNTRLLAPPDERGRARLHETAEALEGVGARLALEFSNTTSLPRVSDAAACLAATAVPGVGLTLDAWHFFWDRAGPDWTGLEALAPGQLANVQLNDGRLPETSHAPREHWLADYRERTMHERRLPGAGDFDLARLADALRRQRFDGPIVLEVLSSADRARPLEDFARDAARSARAWWNPGVAES